MIKSSSEAALRAGSEGGGGYFKIFLGGEASRIFNSRGGFLEYPPLAIPALYLDKYSLKNYFFVKGVFNSYFTNISFPL